MARVVLTCVTMFAFFALANFAVAMAGVDSLAVLMVLLFCSFAFLGLVIPTTMVLALDEHGPIAGVASALGGTLQMLLGGLLIVVLSQFGHDSAVPMLSGIAGCATGAFILSRLTLRRAAAAGPLPLAAESGRRAARGWNNERLHPIRHRARPAGRRRPLRHRHVSTGIAGDPR